MKRNIILIGALFIILASCSKDDDIVDTPDNTTIELLTGNTWKADEIRTQYSNNTSTYYKRGGTTNTADYDADSIKFNINNSGTYYNSGSGINMTWNFTDPQQKKITIVINAFVPVTFYLENIHITADQFKYVQYSTHAGLSHMASVTRTPD
jgi:hypothetical protein